MKFFFERQNDSFERLEMKCCALQISQSSSPCVNSGSVGSSLSDTGSSEIKNEKSRFQLSQYLYDRNFCTGS